ncbi:MAG: ATP-binding cassette domain-containing protein [Acidobacteria bacterium]|nr:ATP-binding cassette domain-containing protein [Acidobacteriota bacterium]
MVENAIKIEGVAKHFDKTVAVKELSMAVPAGSIYGLLGPNGAGKTTTIRMMLNIIYPDQGQIELFGRKLTEEDKSRIGYLPEERGLYPKMTVDETLLYFARLKGIQTKLAKKAIDYWLDKVNIIEHRQKKINELSKGMQQKIQFVATVQHNPDLLILDEPFSGLDPINVKLIKDIILELNSDGKTIIFSTHQMEQVEKLCEYICLINKGKKIIDGKQTKIRSEYGRNTVLLEFDGDGSFLKDEKGIADINLFPRQAEISLRRETSAPELLKNWVKKLDITKFEVLEPSVESIFIRLVGESNE